MLAVSIDRDLMRETARLAESYDCQLHTHLCETADEERFCLAMYGVRPVELLEEAGWMSRRTWLAHGIHFNADEIRRLGAAGVGVCCCAASNMVLASGICPTCELEAAGAPLGLGVDGSASNDSSNMMEAVRHALMIGRLRYGAAAITHLDALRWATEGSARCLGRDDVGRSPPAASRSGAVPARRAALLRRSRSLGGAGAVRRPSRRPGDGRRGLAGDRRRAGRPRSGGFGRRASPCGPRLRVRDDLPRRIDAGGGFLSFAAARGEAKRLRRPLAFR